MWIGITILWGEGILESFTFPEKRIDHKGPRPTTKSILPGKSPDYPQHRERLFIWAGGAHYLITVTHQNREFRHSDWDREVLSEKTKRNWWSFLFRKGFFLFFKLNHFSTLPGVLSLFEKRRKSSSLYKDLYLKIDGRTSVSRKCCAVCKKFCRSNWKGIILSYL